MGHWNPRYNQIYALVLYIDKKWEGWKLRWTKHNIPQRISFMNSAHLALDDTGTSSCCCRCLIFWNTDASFWGADTSATASGPATHRTYTVARCMTLNNVAKQWSYCNAINKQTSRRPQKPLQALRKRTGQREADSCCAVAVIIVVTQRVYQIQLQLAGACRSDNTSSRPAHNNT